MVIYRQLVLSQLSPAVPPSPPHNTHLQLSPPQLACVWEGCWSILWTGTQPNRPDLTAAAAAHPPKLGFSAVPWSPKQATPLSTLESEAESERKLEVEN